MMVYTFLRVLGLCLVLRRRWCVVRPTALLHVCPLVFIPHPLKLLHIINAGLLKSQSVNLRFHRRQTVEVEDLHEVIKK